jgi:hypothetical protein
MAGGGARDLGPVSNQRNSLHNQNIIKTVLQDHGHRALLRVHRSFTFFWLKVTLLGPASSK